MENGPRRLGCLCAGLLGLSLLTSERGSVAADPVPGKASRAPTASKREAESKPAREARPKCDPARAMGYLTELCRIGPRFSGSAGMDRQQKLISEHMTRLKWRVRYQTFDAPHPVNRQPVRMTNLIVECHPGRKDRILIACHYDTRPLPDQDPNPQLARDGVFVGANDGASGVALLMELAHQIGQIETRYGVDLVLFDGEELIYGQIGEFFVGSTYFADQYRIQPPEHRYHYGVLVDMIGDKNLAIYQEKNSVQFAPGLVRSVWDAARIAGVKEFVPRIKHEVRDDHLPLNEIAKIPTIDLIDFDYPYWHTTRDVSSSCSGASLAKVGNVLLEWLANLPAAETVVRP